MYVDPGLRFGIVTATSAASTVRAADHSSGYSLYSMTAPAGAATEIVADVSVHVFHSGFGSAVIVARYGTTRSGWRWVLEPSAIARTTEERLEMGFGAERDRRHDEERLEMGFGAERLQPIARYARHQHST